MSANETVHTSDTGGQKAGNLERYDLIPAEPLRRLAIHAGTAVYAGTGSFNRMMQHAWAFWRGEEIEAETDWVNLIAAAWEAFRIVDPTRPPLWIIDNTVRWPARYDRIPAEPLRQLAEHFGRGAVKYAADNWTKGYDWRLTFAAANRHAWQWFTGETHDPETGSHHLIAFAWHMLVLDEFTRINRGGDTRYCTRVHSWLEAERAHRVSLDAQAAEARLALNPETVALLVEAGAHIDQARAIAGCVQQDPRCPSLCLSCDRVRPRVIEGRGLGEDEKDAEWIDIDGDRYRYHLPGTGMGRWQMFGSRLLGEWVDAEPEAIYAPYFEAREPRPARVIEGRGLGRSERGAEWADIDGATWAWRTSDDFPDGAWHYHHAGGAEPCDDGYWTDCGYDGPTSAAYAPYTEVLATATT